MQQTATAAVQLDPKLLLKTLRAFRKGDFSVRLPLDLTGIDGEIAEAFNDIADFNQGLTRELDRVDRPQALVKFAGAQHVQDVVAVLAERIGGQPAPHDRGLEQGFEGGHVTAAHGVQPGDDDFQVLSGC